MFRTTIWNRRNKNICCVSISIFYIFIMCLKIKININIKGIQHHKSMVSVQKYFVFITNVRRIVSQLLQKLNLHFFCIINQRKVFPHVYTFCGKTETINFCWYFVQNREQQRIMLCIYSGPWFMSISLLLVISSRFFSYLGFVLGLPV